MPPNIRIKLAVLSCSWQWGNHPTQTCTPCVPSSSFPGPNRRQHWRAPSAPSSKPSWQLAFRRTRQLGPQRLLCSAIHSWHLHQSCHPAFGRTLLHVQPCRDPPHLSKYDTADCPGSLNESISFIHTVCPMSEFEIHPFYILCIHIAPSHVICTPNYNRRPPLKEKYISCRGGFDRFTRTQLTCRIGMQDRELQQSKQFIDTSCDRFPPASLFCPTSINI